MHGRIQDEDHHQVAEQPDQFAFVLGVHCELKYFLLYFEKNNLYKIRAQATKPV